MSWRASDSSAFGSSLKVGVRVSALGVPDLVNTPDFLRKDISATIPFLVPRISVRTIVGDVLCRMWRCWVYLGHLWMMCSLVWNVWLSHGHVVGLLEFGRKFLWNSPEYACPIRH